MLKANELRVGNIVSTVKLNNGIVRGITDEKIMVKFKDSTISSNIDFFYPIPLTEEILLKCGFKLSPKGFNYDKKRLSICLHCDSYKNGRVYFNSWCISEKSIDSLHQLQNLYFALTNEELTFNNL